MSEKLCNLIGGGMKEMIDLVYPVGRTITCDHNPQDDYPWQIWTQDFKDRFPLGAGDSYAAGSTGGEATHTLSVDEMPSHKHGVAPLGGHYITAWGDTSDNTQSFALGKISENNGGTKNRLATERAGGDQPHNNMPPYKAVCMWTRTA